MRGQASLGVIAICIVGASCQTWCGKNYKPEQPVVPPGGEFAHPPSLEQPHLSFRCAPAIKPYLGEDTSGAFLIDTEITHTFIRGAVPIDSVDRNSEVTVTISVNGHNIAHGSVPLATSAHSMPFSLESLEPQKKPYSVLCIATAEDGRTFRTTSSILRLPDPKSGSVTKMDLRTGALLVKKSNKWESIFPIGFYTNFGGYLAKDLDILDDLKERGFNIVHPIPTFDDIGALERVIERMEKLGLYLMYDMRHSYKDAASVTEQVNRIKKSKALLLWYTADEPDGPGDALDATKKTYDLINELDGYHPVSLALNCQDYEFAAYSSGADIILQDAYPVGVSAEYSKKYGTPCTKEYGCCGCDNCEGRFEDISERVNEYRLRLKLLGEGRTKTVWGVPQAFDGTPELFWERVPTGKEFLVSSILAINHGVTGICPWNDPTPSDIKRSATTLAQSLPYITPFLFDPKSRFRGHTERRIDVGVWTVGTRTLLLATNMNDQTAGIDLVDIVPDVRKSDWEEVLNNGAILDEDRWLKLKKHASVAIIFNAPDPNSFSVKFQDELERFFQTSLSRIHDFITYISLGILA